MGVRVAMSLALVGAAACIAPQVAAASNSSNFGSNVIVFNPSMSQATIQAKLNEIATQQVPNQFGSQRYAIFFEPGTYGSTADPLTFQVGYYTQVAGLGARPGDVVINGGDRRVQPELPGAAAQGPGGTCDGLNNFWRSLSNLTLNVAAAAPTASDFVPATNEDAGCNNNFEFWAVSQAAPMRRVDRQRQRRRCRTSAPTGFRQRRVPRR